LGNAVLVTGAGGFIGHHLVSFLRAQGYWVRGADLKRPEFCASGADEFELLDLRNRHDCLRATAGIDEVYGLAADTGGVRFAEVLRWEPQVSVEEGLRPTYLWIAKQVREAALEYSFGVAAFPPPGSN
jgi:nucleoside-diphosphate-sugar epimerase